MANPRISDSGPSGSIRPEEGGNRVAAARPAKSGRAGRFVDRIPTLRQLAALVVDGVLTLPKNYRRGMFLDMLV